MTSSPQPPEIPIRRITRVDWLDPPHPAVPALPVPLVNSAMAIGTDGRRALSVGGYAPVTGKSVAAVAEFDFGSRVWMNSSVSSSQQQGASSSSGGGNVSGAGGIGNANNTSTLGGGSQQQGGSGGGALPCFPYAISEAGMVCINGKFYVYGGWDDGFTRGDVHVIAPPSSPAASPAAVAGGGTVSNLGATKGGGSSSLENALLSATANNNAFSGGGGGAANSSSGGGASGLVVGAIALADGTLVPRWDCIFRGAYRGKNAHKVSAPHGTFPRSRRGASIAAGTLEGRSVFFIFGGFDGSRRLNDLWAFDVDSFHWIEIQANSPLAAAAARAQPAASAGALPSSAAGVGALGSSTTTSRRVSTSYFKNTSSLAAVLLGEQTLFSNTAAPSSMAGSGGSIVAGSPAAAGITVTPAAAADLSTTGAAVNTNAAATTPAENSLSHHAAIGSTSFQQQQQQGGGSSGSFLPPAPQIVVPSLVPPAPRDGAAMVFDHLQSRLLFFGGYDDTVRNDVYELRFVAAGSSFGVGGEISSGSSSALVVARGSVRKGGAARGHRHDGDSEEDESEVDSSSSSDNDDADEALIVEARNAQWSRIHTINAPPPLQGCVALINGHHLVVGFGCDRKGSPSKGLYQLNLADWSWSICNLEGDDVVDGRAGCAFATTADRKRSLIFGGLTADGRYLYSGLDIEWERPEVIGGKAKR